MKCRFKRYHFDSGKIKGKSSPLFCMNLTITCLTYKHSKCECDFSERNQVWWTQLKHLWYQQASQQPKLCQEHGKAVIEMRTKLKIITEIWQQLEDLRSSLEKCSPNDWGITLQH